MLLPVVETTTSNMEYVLYLVAMIPLLYYR
jgi:hypothetical protein